MAMEVGIL